MLMKKEKQIMIKLQAAPKTHPSGVQGAFLEDWYQSEKAPSPESRAPIYKAPKLSAKKTIRYSIDDLLFKSWLATYSYVNIVL